MKRILADRSFRLAFLLTFLFFGVGLVFLFAGWVLYGWVLFILLPIVLGISLGAMPERKATIIGMLIATVIFLLGMYVPGLSGLLCIVMVLPIIVPMIFLGYVITYLAQRYRQLKEVDRLPVLLAPLLVFIIAAPVEQFLHRDPEAVVSVSTERIYPYPPEVVFDAIKSVDTLDAPKPYLMNFDLPVPVKCVLEEEKVGALRTCYFVAGRLSKRDFGAGTIVERVTAIERGKVLKMDVVNYDLVGRKWIGFREAIYYFEPAGQGCKLTRITTYTSVLGPRFFWEPMERLGIEQEHDYVLDNLQKDLERLALNASASTLTP